MTTDRQKRLMRMADIPGLLLGIQILLKGVDKLPDFGHHPLHVSFFLLAGGFVFAGSILHHLLEKRVKNVHALFHLLEGAALATSALLLFERGKLRMPLVLLLLGILYAVLGLVGLRLNRENSERIGRRLFRWVGVVFVAAGLVMAGLNVAHDRDVWVFIIAGIFLASGFVYLLFGNWLTARLGRTAGVGQEGNGSEP